MLVRMPIQPMAGPINRQNRWSTQHEQAVVIRSISTLRTGGCWEKNCDKISVISKESVTTFKMFKQDIWWKMIWRWQRPSLLQMLSIFIFNFSLIFLDLCCDLIETLSFDYCFTRSYHPTPLLPPYTLPPLRLVVKNDFHIIIHQVLYDSSTQRKIDKRGDLIWFIVRVQTLILKPSVE